MMEHLEKQIDEEEKREYLIDFEVQIIYTGEKLPDKGYVVNPIEDFIHKRLEKFKHDYRLRRIKITIDELEEELTEEDDEF